MPAVDLRACTAPDARVSGAGVVAAALSFPDAGVPHRRTHSPLRRLVERRLAAVAIHFRFRSVLPVVARPVAGALAEPRRLVGEADAPFAEAGELEVGGHRSLGPPRQVDVVVVVVVRRALAKASVARRRRAA